MSDLHSPPRLRAVVLLLALSLLYAAGAGAQDQPPVAPDLPPDGWSLEMCVAAALRGNPAVAIARASIWSSEAAIDRARSDQYPQVTADASATTGSSAASTGPWTTTSSNLGVGVDWTFWETGRHDTVMQSRSNLDASRMDYADVLQSLVEEVAVDYYAVLASRELVAVAEDGLRASEQQLAEVLARIADGDLAEVEQYSAEADRASAELDLIDARTGEQLALANLRNAIALDRAEAFSVRADALYVDWQPPALEEAIALAAAGRPNLLSRQATVRARQYALESARDQRRPQFSVGGSGGLEPFAGERRRLQWSLSAKVTWPLFDGDARKAQETQARASLQQARATLRQAELQASLEVEQAYIELERTEERIRASERSLAAARAQLDGARGRYAEDKGILLEVTTARAALTGAEANLVQARFDRQVALISLRRATGTLPVPDVAPAAPEGEATAQ